MQNALPVTGLVPSQEEEDRDLPPWAHTKERPHEVTVRGWPCTSQEQRPPGSQICWHPHRGHLVSRTVSSKRLLFKAQSKLWYFPVAARLTRTGVTE